MGPMGPISWKKNADRPFFTRKLRDVFGFCWKETMRMEKVNQQIFSQTHGGWLHGDFHPMVDRIRTKITFNKNTQIQDKHQVTGIFTQILVDIFGKLVGKPFVPWILSHQQIQVTTPRRKHAQFPSFCSQRYLSFSSAFRETSWLLRVGGTVSATIQEDVYLYFLKLTFRP